MRNIIFIFIVLFFTSAYVSAENGCVDSDKGKKYFKEGYVFESTNNEPPILDVCVGDGTLFNTFRGRAPLFFNDNVREGFCGADKQIETVEYKCPYGCAYGACFGRTTKLGLCVDPDGGLNYYKKSTVVNKKHHNKLTDYCSNQNSNEKLDEGKYIREFACINAGPNPDSTVVILYKCPNGCRNGACIKSSK